MLLDTDLSVNISIIDLLLIKSKENKFEIATFLIKIDFDQVLEFILSRTVLNRVELSALTVPLSGNRPLSSTKVRIGHKSVERSNKNPILSRFQISSFLNRSLIRSEILMPSPSIQYATKLFICKWETIRNNKKGTTYSVSNFGYRASWTLCIWTRIELTRTARMNFHENFPYFWYSNLSWLEVLGFLTYDSEFYFVI